MIVGIIVGTIIIILLAGFIVISLLLYKNAQVKHNQKIEELINEFEREILRSQLETKEETLKLVSHEIHDNLGQKLSLIKLNLSLITLNISVDKNKINQTKQLVLEVIQDIRKISRNLNSEEIKNNSISKLVEKQIISIKSTGKFQIDLKIFGDEPFINHQIHLIAFRMIQETINNMIKHSEADNVYVELKFKKKSFEYKIQDNGKGFNAELYENGNLNALGGSGIKSIHQRIKILGGQLKLNSKLNEGTNIWFAIPLNQVNYE